MNHLACVHLSLACGRLTLQAYTWYGHCRSFRGRQNFPNTCKVGSAHVARLGFPEVVV